MLPKNVLNWVFYLPFVCNILFPLRITLSACLLEPGNDSLFRPPGAGWGGDWIEGATGGDWAMPWEWNPEATCAQILALQEQRSEVEHWGCGLQPENIFISSLGPWGEHWGLLLYCLGKQACTCLRNSPSLAVEVLFLVADAWSLLLRPPSGMPERLCSFQGHFT